MTLTTRAPAVLWKWVQWSFKNRYIDEEQYQDFLLAVPVSKGRETKRLQKATKLLAKLYKLTPEELILNLSYKLVPIQDIRIPEEIVEG